MKLASVALGAIAVALATPAAADDHTPAAQAVAEYPMTPQGAADWIAMVERDLFDYSVRAGRVYWVNATYITQDTDAMAAAVGAEGTQKSVQYALEAARSRRAEQCLEGCNISGMGKRSA